MHTFNEAVKDRPMLTGATTQVDLIDCSGDECVVGNDLNQKDGNLEELND
jgi:hypothetical protein